MVFSAKRPGGGKRESSFPPLFKSRHSEQKEGGRVTMAGQRGTFSSGPMGKIEMRVAVCFLILDLEKREINLEIRLLAS